MYVDLIKNKTHVWELQKRHISLNIKHIVLQKALSFSLPLICTIKMQFNIAKETKTQQIPLDNYIIIICMPN